MQHEPSALYHLCFNPNHVVCKATILAEEAKREKMKKIQKR
jgi:hypothetical protein